MISKIDDVVINKKYAENKYAINSLKTIRIFDPIKVTEILLLGSKRSNKLKFCLGNCKIGYERHGV